jgi:hypothetical protein
MTDPEKLKTLQEWPTLRNKHEIRSFLGLCTYYRRFVFSFAIITKPLTRLMEEMQALQRTPEVGAAFQTLKEALYTTSILAYLQPGEKYASNVGMGGILSQVQDVQERVIACYSKTLE